MTCGASSGIIATAERASARPTAGTLGHALATTAFPLILLWYLNRALVKTAFGLADE
jgi:hypothetical protein